MTGLGLWPTLQDKYGFFEKEKKKPVTYGTRNQQSQSRRDKGLAGRTGSHPKIAENPGVSQPVLVPDVMSLKANHCARPYSQGLRKPSGALPFDRRSSLSSEKMAAAVYTSELSPVLKDGQPRAEERRSNR
jgi:hypothetical protein